MQRTSETLTTLIHKYLSRNSLCLPNPPWDIKKSELGGFGVFANRDIEIGELIFKDHPVILGPRANIACPLLCVTCYNRGSLKPCEKKCGLLVCSQECQNSTQHQKECKIIRQWQTEPISEELSQKLNKVLAPIRSLLLSEEDKKLVKFLKAHRSEIHGFEVNVMKDILHLDVKEDEEEFMRFVCCAMDANAFEVIVGNENNQSSVKGLYPLGSLANHSCTPNTIHVFDDDQKMVVRASTFIPKEAEIFHSYSRIIWGTPTRRFHLHKTKHFLCKCLRCQDPTEFGSYMSAILCKICKTGKVVSIDPLIQNGKWQCEECGEIMKNKDIADTTSLLGSVLNSFADDDVQFMLRFLEKKLPAVVSENNEVIVELKYKLIWILGYHEAFIWTELPNNLLQAKEKFCYELLALLEKLRVGQCKVRGLLLYELYCCLLERSRREKKSVTSKDHKTLLLEAADILMYDVGAPKEVKNLWPQSIQNQIN